MATFSGHRNVNHYTGQEAEAWRSFTCAHCAHKVSGVVVSAYLHRGDGRQVHWLLCPNCVDGSVVTAFGATYPAGLAGPEVLGLPDAVAAAYSEVRSCMAVGAHTATEQLCRKILMHIAVEKGATEGKTFVAYLSDLESQGYITPSHEAVG